MISVRVLACRLYFSWATAQGNEVRIGYGIKRHDSRGNGSVVPETRQNEGRSWCCPRFIYAWSY